MEVEEPIPEDKDAEKKDGDVSLHDLSSNLFSLHVFIEDARDEDDDQPAIKRDQSILSSKRSHDGKPKLTHDVKAMDTDAADKPKTRKVKKQVRKGDLPVVSATLSLDDAAKTTAAEAENDMIMSDKLVADTEDKKNELETYIYDMRNKIDDTYADFASEDEKTKLKAKLEAAEVSF
jgi:heat shock protein 4